jgi:hypothetical protein
MESFMTRQQMGRFAEVGKIDEVADWVAPKKKALHPRG